MNRDTTVDPGDARVRQDLGGVSWEESTQNPANRKSLIHSTPCPDWVTTTTRPEPTTIYPMTTADPPEFFGYGTTVNPLDDKENCS